MQKSLVLEEMQMLPGPWRPVTNGLVCLVKHRVSQPFGLTDQIILIRPLFTARNPQSVMSIGFRGMDTSHLLRPS